MHFTHRPHLLVVDDESPIREALKSALQPAYVVHTAASGAEALACLSSHPIASIILDAILGEEHGLDLVDDFHARSAAPILLLTGHGSEDLAGRAVWAGVQGYLKKPVSIPLLFAAVERLAPSNGGPAAVAARARRHVDENFAEPLRTVELAHQLGVSERHLRRLFQATYDKTLQRHLTETRIRRATYLLRTTALGLKAIAEAVGFRSHTRFGKVFHAIHGVTPSEYRAGRGRPGKEPDGSPPRT